jgi:Holliday junction resolvase RusA-like endonuclease
MITNILFVVPGEPYGKGRARSTKSGRHYTPEKTVSYERLVGWTAKQAMGSKQPLSGALMVHVEAFCSVPTSWSKKKTG